MQERAALDGLRRAPAGWRGCTTGRANVLDLKPGALDERVPVMLGSKEEIERIERYHREFDEGTDKPYVNPLFKERSLYREAASG